MGLTNLPAQTTAFVGRSDESADALATLEESRLVTLTGVGGVGKTRLALHIAAEAMPLYADGVWLVELGGVSDPEAIDETVAAALGVAQQPGETIFDTVLSYLRNKRMLIVLDNCEHLLAGSARIAEAVLSNASGVRILATSREPLTIRGERILGVPSLPVPEPDLDVAAMAAVPAVELFVDRARAAVSGFRLDAETADAIGLLCRRLDGIPLALELAAARVRSMTPADINDRLEHRFRLLTGGARGVVNRHQTLRSAIDWSYDLLDADERTLLGRLAVCVGGFTLDAAEAVGGGEGVDPIEVDDILARLVDKSLVVMASRAGRTRYRLLETIRAYALERLAETGEAAQARNRHAAFYADFVSQVTVGLKGPEEPTWIAHIDEELDNLRAAVSWSLDGDDPAPAVGIVAGLAFQGISVEASLSTWAMAVVACPLAESDPRFLAVRGFLAWATWREGKREEADDLVRALYQRLDEAPPQASVLCRALSGATAVHASIGKDPGPRALQWVEAARAVGDRYEEALALNMLSVGPTMRGEEAWHHASRSLVLAKETGSPSAIAFCSFICALSIINEDPPQAEQLLDDALRSAKVAGNTFAYLVALGIRGGLLQRRGDYQRAAEACRESARHAYTYGHRSQAAATIWILADCLAELGRGEAAAVLMGWVESVLGGSAETAGDGSGPGGVSNFYGEMSALESLPSQLGDRRYAELISIGAAMTDDEAMSYVDDQIGPDRGPEAFTSSVHELESVNEFRPEGDVWLLGYDGEACRLKDSKGMQYLAVLLAQPGREIHVAHLAGASIAESAGTGPALDARAAAEYRNRLSELQSELDEAEDFADPERIARARAEMDALTAELSSAYGLGGRARTGPDPAERVRKAVTNRIRDALDRIEKEHPSMGRHLRNAVRTGTFCSYNPERPTTWTL